MIPEISEDVKYKFRKYEKFLFPSSPSPAIDFSGGLTYNEYLGGNHRVPRIRGNILLLSAPHGAAERGIYMRFHTAVFDLDGTLLDTLQDLADSTNYALAVNGLPGRTVDEVRRFVGNGVGKLIARAVPEGTPEALTAKCLSDFRAHYFLNMENKTAPYPGVMEMLDRLGKAGFHLAIVSNKFDSAVKGLCQTYFGDLIPVAIGESEGVERKPAPDTVFRALAELGVSPEGAVYIGDSDVDIQTAHNSGLPCISVSWGFRDEAFLTEHGATTIAATREELAKLLLNK